MCCSNLQRVVACRGGSLLCASGLSCKRNCKGVLQRVVACSSVLQCMLQRVSGVGVRSIMYEKLKISVAAGSSGFLRCA